MSMDSFESMTACCTDVTSPARGRRVKTGDGGEGEGEAVIN